MASKLDNVIPPGYSKPKKISEGAFGQVLKVLHERSEIEYAMKVLPVLKEGDKERVSREVEMLTRFAHPRIVRLHESIDMGGHYAIVMELGTRSLKDLILEYEARNELIPLPLTVMILSDICEGLLWMHTHSSGSTAHGDLKPENVLHRENNRAFLCDLGGSATLEQHLTQTTGEFGTFEYNSPERMMDSKGTATPASDVWSLGVLAYRMVTGKSLFEGLHLFQMTVALHTFDESKIPLSIDPHVRGVLLKMLEPNVTLRATTSVLFEGGLLERMLGPETALSKLKDIQLATRVNEIKLSSCDAKLKERTMELEMEKQTLLEETKKLESQLRLLQMSLQGTCNRNLELEREEELEQHQNLLATHTAPVPIDPEDNVLSTSHEMPVLLFRKDEKKNTDETSFFDVSGNTITRTGFDMDQNWSTTLFEESISEGVVKYSESTNQMRFGLVDGHSRQIEYQDQLGDNFPSSIALAPVTGALHVALPSNNQRGGETVLVSAPMANGDRMVLEVDMDARPRTAVFIVNGNVPLTFVSGLPPSIRFGLSMKNEGVSVRFDGMTRLKQATPLRRVNEIKWNPEDLRDCEDLYMNGLRANVLIVQTQMPSLVFSDPSHFSVEDKRITSTEGLVAITFTVVMDLSSSACGLIDGTARIPEKGEKLGKIENSIALFSRGELQPLTEEEQKKIDLSLCWQDNKHIVVELNMDSNPRTAQFFIDNKSVPAVVVGLPESVRVGFSAKGPGLSIRFDRITQLNRGSPITDQMNEIEWPTAGPLQAKEVDEDSVGNDEARMPEEGKEKVSLEAKKVNDDFNQEIGKSEEHEEDGDHPTRESDPKDKKTKENRVSDEDTDEENSHSDSDDDKEDDRTDVGRKKRHLPTMKLPQLLFTDKSHFIIRNNVLSRTEKGTDKKERTRPSTVLFSDPITKGVVSVTFIVLAVAESVDQDGFINFGLVDAQTDVPRLGRVLGKDMKHSIALSTRGEIHVFCQAKLEEKSHYFLSRKDRVVIEVNMDSNPRTVQFFVNGKAAAFYVSGIPESFSADVLGTSLEIASIVPSTQATPLELKMKEIKWTDTKQSLNERSRKQYHTILREAKGSMPALLSRNPDHFKIEGNVITHTAIGCHGLTSPFSTVMFRNVGMEIVRYVAITILALPQTENLDGVVLIGCLRNRRLIPKRTRNSEEMVVCSLLL
ncbi:putative calcium-dependent protein kinase [Blattamonas nauphoetae]|uniref:non-specific serine/threonine protein kinase n=1 Tax=Blattamonas nauphoetae TaxID=2049346 RepID=A0ABQ9WWX0_9EUKA|nr:putative calcium-dependent protein kinase [Blattamonas nauphoetae]